MNSVITNKTRFSYNSGILTTAGTALDVTEKRRLGRVQNLSANALFVKLGAGASATDFTVVLPAATAPDDGTSAPWEFGGYTGIVTFAGTTPRCIASEDIA